MNIKSILEDAGFRVGEIENGYTDNEITTGILSYPLPDGLRVEIYTDTVYDGDFFAYSPLIVKIIPQDEAKDDG